MMDEDLDVRNAEEKAIKEAEYIAASESVRLAQELSLRLELSEPNSKENSRSNTVSNLEYNNIEGVDNQEDNNEDENNQVENNEDSNEIKNNDEDIDLKDEEEDIKSQHSNNSVIVKEEILENDASIENEYKIQESKLILNEFSHDSTKFLEEQEENNNNSENTEIVIIEDKKDENEEEEVEEILIVQNKDELIKLKSCTHYIYEMSESTKNGLNDLVSFQNDLFNSCKGNSHYIKDQFEKSTYDYLNYVHSKLIDLAGFHSPDECSICKDFRHQDVPLLN